MYMEKQILPNHIAIIPDGNRRWAHERNLRPWEGHLSGLSQFKQVTHWIFNQDIPYLTFWALSLDNIKKRTQIEIAFLLQYITEELANPETVRDFMAHDVRVRVIGQWKEYLNDPALCSAIENLEEKTRNGKKHLTILFVYDGKEEMMSAIGNLLRTGSSSRADLKKALWTGFLPPVDLVIRTGGEPHWSAGFMMWLTADSQFYFTNTKWPDFDKNHLERSFEDYSKKERRMGK